MNNQKGFTLIELVVVIVILGILSAFAAPKFINIQDDAYQAKIKAVRGSFKAGIAMVHAKSLASQVGTTSAESWLNLDGVAANSWGDDVIVRNGWPYHNTASECRYLFNAIIDDDVVSSTVTTSGDFVATYAADICTFTDNNSGDLWNFSYNITNGSVSQLTQ